MVNPTKICIACKQTKDVQDFNKKSYCRDCRRLKKAAWYQENKESEKEKARIYGRSEKRKAKQRERYKTDEEYRKKRREQCRASKQKESSRQKVREYQRMLRATKPQHRLRLNVSRRIRDVLMGTSKSSSTMILIGCNTDELRGYIESLWKPGMSWENYGIFGWHIDHIIPCAAFDLSKPEEQRKCFHYTNLQPLWAIDNWRKHDWVPDYQI